MGSLEEQIELEELTQEEFTETHEIVEETPTAYTEAIYDTGSYIVSITLFAVFAVLGFLSGTHILGRVKL